MDLKTLGGPKSVGKSNHSSFTNFNDPVLEEGVLEDTNGEEVHVIISFYMIAQFSHNNLNKKFLSSTIMGWSILHLYFEMN